VSVSQDLVVVCILGSGQKERFIIEFQVMCSFDADLLTGVSSVLAMQSAVLHTTDLISMF